MRRAGPLRTWWVAEAEVRRVDLKIEVEVPNPRHDFHRAEGDGEALDGEVGDDERQHRAEDGGEEKDQRHGDEQGAEESEREEEGGAEESEEEEEEEVNDRSVDESTELRGPRHARRVGPDRQLHSTVADAVRTGDLKRAPWMGVKERNALCCMIPC